MERQVAEADAVRFFELAHVDFDIRRQSSEACVVLKDFIIPSEDLIPAKVREEITPSPRTHGDAGWIYICAKFPARSWKDR